MIVVVDSSSLISLARIGKLDILKDMFDKIYIPQDVFEEVVTTGRNRPGSKEIEDAIWIEKREMKGRKTIESLARESNLSRGELATIMLAKELNADLIILDEKRARKVAEFANVNVMGTAGVLEQAYQKGMISNLKEVLDELKESGFRLSEKVYYEILRS